MEYLQPEDVARTTHGPARVRVLTRILAVPRFHLDALGQCTTTVANMQEVETCENLDFPYEQR